MENITIFCSDCNHHLGSCPNIWLQIGEKLISPLKIAGDTDTRPLDIALAGASQLGPRGTLFEACRGQRVVCTQCASRLGSIWRTPDVNHILQTGQLCLRIHSLQIRDSGGHNTVRPTIQRQLDPKSSPKSEVLAEDNAETNHHSRSSENHNHGHATNGASKIDFILNEVNTQRVEIERIDRAGSHVVASLNQSAQQISQEVAKIKNDLTQVSTKNQGLADDVWSTRSEIRRIQEILQPLAAQSQLEPVWSAIKDAIAEAKAELRVELRDEFANHQQQLDSLGAALKNTKTELRDCQATCERARVTAEASMISSKANAEEIVALRAELLQSRHELTLERSRESPNTHSIVSQSEVDILATTIRSIAQRASQVETLQMELDLLRGRVQKMEARTTSTEGGPVAGLQRLEEPQNHQPTNSSQMVANVTVPEATLATFIPEADRASQSQTIDGTASYAPPSSKRRKI
ncbi:hypothetical protein F4808DRAFT_390260 [Astrocystis sublimbata]|nr:hypothetical protein F4808DRAFT_390260 [Astrocystis sublimbata]